MLIDHIAIILGILIPVLVLAMVILSCYAIRCIRARSFNNTYREVNHNLDNEEIEFRKILESQHHPPGEYAEYDVDEEGEEEIEFNSHEINQLQILDKLKVNKTNRTYVGNSTENPDDYDDFEISDSEELKL